RVVAAGVDAREQVGELLEVLERVDLLHAGELRRNPVTGTGGLADQREVQALHHGGYRVARTVDPGARVRHAEPFGQCIEVLLQRRLFNDLKFRIRDHVVGRELLAVPGDQHDVVVQGPEEQQRPFALAGQFLRELAQRLGYPGLIRHGADGTQLDGYRMLNDLVAGG